MRQSMPISLDAPRYSLEKDRERTLLRQKFVLFLASDKKGLNTRESRRRRALCGRSLADDRNFI
jgi:hypothetical protein